jgi:hypothetical protein
MHCHCLHSPKTYFSSIKSKVTEKAELFNTKEDFGSNEFDCRLEERPKELPMVEASSLKMLSKDWKGH